MGRTRSLLLICLLTGCAAQTPDPPSEPAHDGRGRIEDQHPQDQVAWDQAARDQEAVRRGEWEATPLEDAPGWTLTRAAPEAPGQEYLDTPPTTVLVHLLGDREVVFSFDDASLTLVWPNADADAVEVTTDGDERQLGELKRLLAEIADSRDYAGGEELDLEPLAAVWVSLAACSLVSFVSGIVAFYLVDYAAGLMGSNPAGWAGLAAIASVFAICAWTQWPTTVEE